MPSMYSTMPLTVSALTLFFATPYTFTTRKDSHRSGISSTTTASRISPAGSQTVQTKPTSTAESAAFLIMFPLEWVRIFS